MKKSIVILAVSVGIVLLAILPATAAVVPNVKGMTIQKAAETLSKAQLGHAVQVVPTDKKEAHDTVFQQTPPAGVNIAPGGRVNLMVYRYQAPAGGKPGVPPAAGANANQNPRVVPQVTSAKAEQAQAHLVGMGFKVSTVFVDTPDQTRNGYVAQQAPAAGQQAQPGSTVTLHVYRFKNQMVAVPQVTAVKAEQAQGKLVGMGFKVSTAFIDTPDQTRNGYVAKQTPAAGQQAQPGSTVALQVYRFKNQMVAVPQVTAVKAEQAQGQLAGMGFKVSTTFVDTPDQSRNGVVAKQTPAAGQQVQPGSVVSLQVYRAKATK